MKKVIITIIILLLIAGGVVGGIYYIRHRGGASEEGMVYVETVAAITGGGISDNRYMGVVDPQETKSINKDADKKVKQVYVKVEDEVKTGDKLFEYDMEEMELKLRQLELELTSLNNGISTIYDQINELAKERDEAPADHRMVYTAQIQNLEIQINQSNYDVSAKQLEIDRQKAAMENVVVVSPMDGIIKDINDGTKKEESSDNSAIPMDGDTNAADTGSAYIKIMAKGQYRIKATADETNARSLAVGTPVIITPRIGDTMTWHGTISMIDLEHPIQNDDGYYGGGETTTKYPFYVDLDSVDGLMLGQHVYVEQDLGQGEKKDGLWLDDYYIMQDESGAYVWKEGEDGKIHKTKVELGAYDDVMLRYEIVSGLSKSDYIAFPEDRIKEGMKTTRNMEDVAESGEMNMDPGAEDLDMTDFEMPQDVPEETSEGMPEDTPADGE